VHDLRQEEADACLVELHLIGVHERHCSSLRRSTPLVGGVVARGKRRFTREQTWFSFTPAGSEVQNLLAGRAAPDVLSVSAQHRLCGLHPWDPTRCDHHS